MSIIEKFDLIASKIESYQWMDGLPFKLDISDPDIPKREPDEIDKFDDLYWELGNDRTFRISARNKHKYWYKGDKLHREDGPAIKYSNGGEAWYLDGLRHREDGPALIEYDGQKEWFKNGIQHREDGPAIEYVDGTVDWYLNGKLIKSKNYDSPQFKKRWQKLLELERVRQVMED